MLFSKPEYKEIMLPFRYINDPEDLEAGIISIEAYGHVFREQKYCYASYNLDNPNMYENGDYEEMIKLLKVSDGKMVKVIIKVKKGMPKDFKIDVNSLVEEYNDERFKALELGGWGFFDKSFEEKRYENFND